MDEEPELTNSALEREVTVDGLTVSIFIYRFETDDDWVLEVADHRGGSTVWDDRFPTDQAALDEALKAIEEDGIESFMVEDARELADALDRVVGLPETQAVSTKVQRNEPCPCGSGNKFKKCCGRS
jgi:hypothetical protein